MQRVFNIYKNCMLAAFSSVSAYRTNFIISMIITISGNVILPLVTFLIYQNGGSYTGWNYYEVLLIQSIFMMASGLEGMIFREMIWQTLHHIREGIYEVILLKPLNPLFYLIATTFSPENIGVFLGGLALFIIAVVNIASISLFSWLVFLVLFLSGVMVMGGFSMMMAATTFKWVGNSRIYELFGSVQQFGKYPLFIFPKALQLLITFIIPVAAVAFYPASALLGRSGVEVLYLCIPCLLFFFFGVWIYQKMIKLYEGVGG